MRQQSSDQISVAERATATISPKQFRALQDSPAFVQLLEGGIFSLIRSKATPYGLKAGAFVGQAILESGLTVAAAEKTPGAISALLHWALPSQARNIDVPAPGGDGGYLLRLFVQEFTHRLGMYLAQGRLKEYRAVPRTSGSPHGRLDVQRTIRLRARGTRDRVAFLHSELTADIVTNQLFALALFMGERAAAGPELGTVRSRIRSHALMFEDASGLAVRSPDRSELKALFDHPAVFEPTPVTAAALAYARIIVLNAGLWPETTETALPEAFFLDLETLFEEAVRQTIREASPGEVVRVGASWRRTLFSDRPGYHVEPDITFGGPGRFQLLLDCKYKDAPAPSREDLYQLGAHAGAFKVPRAVLVYPGDSYSFRPIGTLRDGIRMWSVLVRPTFLLDDMQSLLGDLARASVNGAEQRDGN